LEEGIYYIRTKLPNDAIDFIQEDISFKVNDQKIKFIFNHHYFVKNNDPENKLKILVEDYGNEFGCRIVENIENKTLNNSSNNCSIFEYPIYKIGIIRFNYYDRDGYIIPINDYITIVSTYSQFFSFNEKFCFYYIFDISIDILNSYKNKLNIKVFLKGHYNSIISLNNSEDNENKYTYKDINSSFFDIQGFDLYISEEILDDKIYLYKSSKKLKFTDIKTPEFIIEPNKTIVFSDVNCDLSSSTFIIKKIDKAPIQNYLTYWKYDSLNRYLYMNISGDFYLTKRFKYYYYQLDNNNISNISNKNEIYKTFVSKRLNDTNFVIKKEDTNDYANIINKEKDFYFPLISGLNTIQKYRNPFNKTSSRNELIIDIDESTIKFNYNLAINDVLTIYYLERMVYEWEEKKNLGNSIYYFFNKDNIINGSSLAISPKVFAFNIPTKEEYIITILYSNEKQKNYRKTNLTNCVNLANNIWEQECFIDFSKFRNNLAQSIIINITDNSSYFTENIDFVYYHLDDNSKKCQTMSINMNNITLLVDIPNNNLKEKLKLYSPDTDIINEKRENNRISFILNGTNINLQSTYLSLYTDDEELEHWFTLQDLGIDILPKYKMKFKNNKNITYLLPEDNQVVKVLISTENNEIINLGDISGFQINLYFCSLNSFLI